MKKAIWNGEVLAQSDKTVEVDGNTYFPEDSLESRFFLDSPTTTVCGWKGTANYYTLEGSGQKNADAAWTYRDPKPEAEKIRGHVAFWKGVEVS